MLDEQGAAAVSVILTTACLSFRQFSQEVVSASNKKRVYSASFEELENVVCLLFLREFAAHMVKSR